MSQLIALQRIAQSLPCARDEQDIRIDLPRVGDVSTAPSSIGEMAFPGDQNAAPHIAFAQEVDYRAL